MFVLVEETSHQKSSSSAQGEEDDLVQTTQNNLLDNVLVHNECNPDKEHTCDIHEECQLVVTESLLGYVCQCKQGYEVNKALNRCIGKFQ